MDEKEKQLFLKKLLSISKMVDFGGLFFKELYKCLKYCLLHDDNFCARFGITDDLKITDAFRHLTSQLEIGGSHPPPFNNFCKIVSYFKRDIYESTVILQMFSKVIQAVKSKPKLDLEKKGGKIKISYQNCFVNLQQAVDEITDTLRKIGKTIGNVCEIQIFATDILLANTSFSWNGINVTVASKEIVVKETCVWDVSGHSAQKHEVPKAQGGYSTKQSGISAQNETFPSSTYQQIHGFAGEDGCHGENGGNVLVVTDNLINGQILTIKSNGGDGADGQNGGDGAEGMDGEDGVGLELSSFKHQFPDPAMHLDGQFEECIQKCIANVPAKGKQKINRQNLDCYCKSDNKLGNEALFALSATPVVMYLHEKFTFSSIQSYCVHYGTKGTPGLKGGDGGSGGKAGLGGYAGKVDFISLSVSTSKDKFEKVTIVCERGKDGKDGAGGKGGQGGKNGRKGPDNARITDCARKETVWYHGDLQLKYSKPVEDIQHYTWCTINKQYVWIQETESLQGPTFAQSGSEAKNIITFSGKYQCQQYKKRHMTSELIESVIQQFTGAITEQPHYQFHMEHFQSKFIHVQNKFLREMEERMKITNESFDFKNVRTSEDICGEHFEVLESYEILKLCEQVMENSEKEALVDKIWDTCLMFELDKWEKTHLITASQTVNMQNLCNIRSRKVHPNKDEKGDYMDSEFSVLTKTKFLENILPNLNEIPGLITCYDGHKLLVPIPHSEGEKELFQRQHLMFPTMDRFVQTLCDDKHAIATGYVLEFSKEFSKHFISLVVNPYLQTIYFLNSYSNNTGLNEYPALQIALKRYCQKFACRTISCSNQSGQNSLAHAYLNAQVLTWGLNKFKSSKEAEDFLQKVTRDVQKMLTC